MIGFRPATHNDVELLTEAIIASEKSGTNTLFYQSVFGLDEAETAELISNIFEEEIEGQEWYIPGFVIAEWDGNPAACLSHWVEGATGLGSGMLKAQALSYFLGALWQNARPLLDAISVVQIPRTQGTLQLENIYTRPEFRGKGIASELINHVIESNGNCPAAEIQLMAENKAALASYTKCGFIQQAESGIGTEDILTLLPGRQKVCLSKQLANGTL